MANHLAASLGPVRPSWLLVPLFAFLSACSEYTGEVNDKTPRVSAVDIQAIRTDIMQVAATHDQEAIGHINRLIFAVDGFLASPDEATQTAARSAWLEAHRAFSSLIPLIHIAGEDQKLFMIDAWPMEPGFLDSLPAWPDSGIINDFTLEISSAMLVQQHGITDASEVSLGFHPIEYFIFLRPIDDFILPEADGDERDRILRRRATLQLMAANLSESILLLDEALYVELELNLTMTEGTDDGIAVLHKLIAASHSTAQHAFAQAGLFTETDVGHCQYSETSAQSLLSELETLREIYRKDNALMKVLAPIDASTAANLDSTLDQALKVLSKDSPGEEELARLPLIVSAISHQLADLERIIDTSP
jgi:hypothetical protein